MFLLPVSGHVRYGSPSRVIPGFTIGQFQSMQNLHQITVCWIFPVHIWVRIFRKLSYQTETMSIIGRSILVLEFGTLITNSVLRSRKCNITFHFYPNLHMYAFSSNQKKDKAYLLQK